MDNNATAEKVPASLPEDGLKEERPSLGSYIWSLLTGSGKKCRRKISVRRKNRSNNKTPKDKQSCEVNSSVHQEEDEDSDGGTFGIQKTEKLKCFVKPRPPTNRRRPTSAAVSSRVMSDLPGEPLPELNLSEIKEEDKEVPPVVVQEAAATEGQDPSREPSPCPSKKEVNTPKSSANASLSSLKDIT